jgi:hypothetical protein
MAVAINCRIRRDVDDKVDAVDNALWLKVTANHGGDPGGFTACCANFGAERASVGSLGATEVPALASLVLVVLERALGSAQKYWNLGIGNHASGGACAAAGERAAR